MRTSPRQPNGLSRNASADFSEITLLTIGRKGYEFLKNRQTIRKNYTGVLSSVNYQTAAMLAQEIIEGYLAGDYDEVFLLYNAFPQCHVAGHNAPADPSDCTAGIARTEETVTQYIYEPSKSELLGELLPKYIEVTMFKAMLESVASEHGARMTAMDSASKNATEMIGKLTLVYNRARQAAITTELMEIISGAESIKG